MKKCVALILALLCLGAFALAEEDALAALTEHHGSLVSTNGEPVTDEELSAVLAACQVVTLGSEKTLHLNVITDLDLLQELLPTYAAAGLVQRGNAAIIVCVSSDRGTSGQYHQPDMSNYVAGGMLAQQICVAAQLKGLGFRVITDCIHESGYSLYAGNEPAPENAVHVATEWEDWLRMFAIPKENYYTMAPDGEPITVMNGKNIQLKGDGYAYFEADDTPALKRRVDYVEGFMTPVAVVLLAHTDDAPQTRVMNADALQTFWDGSFDPYPEVYGGSAANLAH